MICPEELAFLVNTLAIAISKGKTISEIGLIASILTQIADTLAIITIQRARIDECLELKEEKSS